MRARSTSQGGVRQGWQYLNYFLYLKIKKCGKILLVFKFKFLGKIVFKLLY